MSKQRRILVAISGASGAVYAQRILQFLPKAFDKIYLTASDTALSIINDELKIKNLDNLIPNEYQERFEILNVNDLSAQTSSGSHDYEGMIIIPCSMGTAGRIASGVSNDLITRSADVCLKEKRKLILTVRETPLNLIHLRNLTTLAESGATILPASPAFYNSPKTIDDVVDFVVNRVLQAIDKELCFQSEWKA